MRPHHTPVNVATLWGKGASLHSLVGTQTGLDTGHECLSRRWPAVQASPRGQWERVHSSLPGSGPDPETVPVHPRTAGQHSACSHHECLLSKKEGNVCVHTAQRGLQTSCCTTWRCQKACFCVLLWIEHSGMCASVCNSRRVYGGAWGLRGRLAFCGDGFTGVCVSRPVQLHALEAHSLLCG